jgi:hypothetical protein
MAHAATLEMPKSRHPVNVKIPSFQAYRSQGELAAKHCGTSVRATRTPNGSRRTIARIRCG